MSCVCVVADLVIMQVSILMQEWVLEQWEEGEQVSLLAELPAIRAKNWAEREQLGMDSGEEVKDA